MPLGDGQHEPASYTHPFNNPRSTHSTKGGVMQRFVIGILLFLMLLSGISLAAETTTYDAVVNGMRIPVQTEHRFRSKLNTCSIPN